MLWILYMSPLSPATAATDSSHKAPPDPMMAREPHPSSIPEGTGKNTEMQPWLVRTMLHPITNGMSVYLPIVNTDPNRGVTYGVMPIWVLKGRGEDRIRQIHAPSLTYNRTFRWTPTYRYYLYPEPDSSFDFRVSWSQETDRTLYGHYEDYNFLNKDLLLGLQFKYDVDGSNHFYGLGPGTIPDGEANYTRDMMNFHAIFGSALYPGSQWHVNLSHRLQSDKISEGPIDALPDIGTLYPGASPIHSHQTSSLRIFVNHDSRDSPIATTEGALAEFYTETAQRTFASEYVYHRYGTDLRYFNKNLIDDRFVTAGQIKFEQVLGKGTPFWLLPSLGGKYTHRAYGERRFVDRGLLTANLEERFTFYQKAVAGVTTEFEVTPFIGLGTVFDLPGNMKRRYARPVVGAAVRAVAPPQVVGSVDFGVGQEGSSIFMDINYSF